MGKDTKISWATDTFNSVWGCEKVSPACDHCYAETFSKRLGLDLWGKDKPRRFFGEKHWNEPRKWNAEAVRTGVRRRIFVNSMSDTFENRRDLDPVREQLWELIEELTYCDFLLLTKRVELMVQLTPKRWIGGWPANAWALTTAENQRRLDERLPSLLCVPARVRGLSIEPMLGPIVIPESCLPAIQWVIVGGESGSSARPVNPGWIRSLRDQCSKHEVAFHMKQWGEWVPRSQYNGEKKPGDVRWGTITHDGSFFETASPFNGHDDDNCGGGEAVVMRVGTKKSGRLLDGKQWNQTPHDRVPV